MSACCSARLLVGCVTCAVQAESSRTRVSRRAFMTRPACRTPRRRVQAAGTGAPTGLSCRMARAAAFAALLLVGCGSRPPWAEGRMIREAVPANLPAQDYANLPARLLAAHDRVRAAAGAPPLTWDPGLAEAAASYGPALERLGQPRPFPPRAPPRPG